MEIRGMQKTTLIDFPEKMACIVFTPKCNFRCPYCFNPKLILSPESLEKISEKEIIEFLEERKKLLDGIVISGGEPTLQMDLKKFIKKIKNKGFW